MGFLSVLSGGNEGAVGLRKVGAVFGVSKETVSRYFAHVCIRVHDALKSDPGRLWETANEQVAQRGLVTGFPLRVGFVDGPKIERWRPEDEKEREKVYDGRKHCHGFATLKWTNNLGKYIRIDVTDLGVTHDRLFYDQAPPYVSPGEHYSDGEQKIADSGFIGYGKECVCPFKKGM